MESSCVGYVWYYLLTLTASRLHRATHDWILSQHCHVSLV